MEEEKGTEEEEEKENMEEKKETVEEEDLSVHAAAVSSNKQQFPILHWEDLSQRIAELEKQEQERRDQAKDPCGQQGGERTHTGSKGELFSDGTFLQGGRPKERWAADWTHVWEEDKEDVRRCRVGVITSRFYHHRNLQLCFINDSEEEEDGASEVSAGKKHNGCHGAGLKQEVVAALRGLRDQLMSEQKEELSSSSCVVCRKHLDHFDLQQQSVQELYSLRSSLQDKVHALSSELVGHLLVRDQLRTKQDAMLLDIQDLT